MFKILNLKTIEKKNLVSSQLYFWILVIFVWSEWHKLKILILINQKSSIFKTCAVKLKAATYEKKILVDKRCHKQEAISQASSSHERRQLRENVCINSSPTKTTQTQTFEMTKEQDLTYETLNGEQVNRKGKFGLNILACLCHIFLLAFIIGFICKYIE